MSSLSLNHGTKHMVSISEKILFLLEEIIDTTGIVFSQQSLSQKMHRFGQFEKRDFNKTIQRYEKLKYIKKIAAGKYGITQKGKKRIDDFKIRKANFDKKAWDGFWRIIIFDIPEKKKFARDAIRRRLRLYNFYPLQKSVFVCPYNCEEAIDVIGEFFDVHNHIDIIKAKTLGKKESIILNHFDL